MGLVRTVVLKDVLQLQCDAEWLLLLRLLLQKPVFCQQHVSGCKGRNAAGDKKRVSRWRR